MLRNLIFWKIRIFLFFLSVVCFTSCQKDDIVTTEENTEAHVHVQTVNRVTPDDIPDVMNYLNTLGDGRGAITIIRQVGDNNRSSEPDLVIGELQTREIIAVSNGVRTNYTFLLETIESNDIDATTIFNLVVVDKPEGLFSYITEYRPTNAWYLTYRQENNFNSFTGEMLYFTIEGTYLAKATLNQGVVTSAETRNPCDPNDTNNDTSDGGGGDGGPGDGDSGDSGDGDGGDGGVDIIVYEYCEDCFHPEHVPHDAPCAHPICSTIIDINFTDPPNNNENYLLDPCDDIIVDNCYLINGDPCLYGCNADQTGCADAPDDTGGNGVGVLMEDTVDPCDTLNNLINDIDTANAITSLDGASGENNERGFAVSKNPVTGNYTTTPVQGGRSSTGFPAGDNILGGMHLHTQIGTPMFSGEDVAALVPFYFSNSNRADVDNRTYPQDIFLFLESELGGFFITIDNIGALAYMLNTIGVKKLDERIQKKYSKPSVDSQTDYTKALLTVIKDIVEEQNITGNPIRLFRLNSDNETLVEIVLDENGEPEDKPCE